MTLWKDILSGFASGRNSAGTGKERQEIDLPVMSFGDHLGELRKRVILALLGAMAGVSICLIFSDTIINAIYQPYLLALKWGGYPVQLFYHKTTGSIIAYLMTGFKAGLVLASPWIIYQAWQFVAAGLFQRERKVVYKYIAPSISLFLMGVAFFYFLVLPVLLKFIIGFNLAIHVPQVKPYGLEKSVFGTMLPGVNIAKLPTGNQIKPLLIPMAKSDPTHFPPHSVALWFNAQTNQVRIHLGTHTLALQAQPADALFSPLPTLSEYLSFATVMALIFGVSFELPMVMLILAKIGVVKAAQFRQMWRYAVMGLALLAVVLAPTPDFFTFLCIFIPLLLLYVLGIILATMVDRNRIRARQAEESQNSADNDDSSGPSSPTPPDGTPPSGPKHSPDRDLTENSPTPTETHTETSSETAVAPSQHAGETHTKNVAREASDESPMMDEGTSRQHSDYPDDYSSRSSRYSRPPRYPRQNDVSEEP